MQCGGGTPEPQGPKLKNQRSVCPSGTAGWCALKAHIAGWSRSLEEMGTESATLDLSLCALTERKKDIMGPFGVPFGGAGARIIEAPHRDTWGTSMARLLSVTRQTTNHCDFVACSCFILAALNAY